MSIFDISSKCMRLQNLLLEVGFCISLCNPHIASSFLTIVHSMVSNSITFPVPCQLCLVEFFRTNSLSQKTFFALSTLTPIMHKANLQPLHYILCSNEFRTTKGRSLKSGLLLVWIPKNWSSMIYKNNDSSKRVASDAASNSCWLSLNKATHRYQLSLHFGRFWPYGFTRRSTGVIFAPITFLNATLIKLRFCSLEDHVMFQYAMMWNKAWSKCPRLGDAWTCINVAKSTRSQSDQQLHISNALLQFNPGSTLYTMHIDPNLLEYYQYQAVAI